MSIRVFVTGGTFDKKYNELDGTLVFGDTHVSEILHLGRCKLPIKLRTLMMVDSLEMTLEDRQIIVDNCKSCREDKIIITHGTDTMVETAKSLGLQGLSKTIVLTGAMVPFTFGSSDGLFNMGSAVAFVQALPFGVYIAMNGRIFSWTNVRKNRQLGEFEEVDPGAKS
jgi:L-asparaginase